MQIHERVGKAQFAEQITPMKIHGGIAQDRNRVDSHMCTY
jgi:hypothetical protein